MGNCLTCGSSSEYEQLPQCDGLDLTLFKEPNTHEQCKGDPSCGRLQRLAVVLKYHQLLVGSQSDTANARAILLEFVDATYSRALLLADYIDFFSAHSDAASRGALCAQLRALQCGCARVAECAGTARHFRERAQRKEQGLCLDLDLIEALHFNVFHLEHVGLRVPALPSDDEKEDGDEDDLVDAEMRRIAAHILRLRTLFAFERIDNTQNSKFTIKAQEEDALQGATGGIHTYFSPVR